MGALVLWEISKKQEYIFSSNILKENKGASAIIKYIIEELPKEIDEYNCENLIYNGGGNSLYNFKNIDEAKNFVKKISEKLLREYPGVEFFMTVNEYDENNNRLTTEIDKIRNKLAIKKIRREYSGRQISFGIEEPCSSTGLPARKINSERKPISDEIRVKIKASKKLSVNEFSKLLNVKKSVNSFDDLNKDNEKNYMAVVHIDGNRMGKQFEELKKCFEYEEGKYDITNREYKKALKKFSDRIKNAYESAFMEMVQAVEDNKDALKEYMPIDNNNFPVIPIIVAGDDITYVTNAKIGIETARIFLEHLSSKEIEMYGDKIIQLNACAGIALVKISHPFSEAYSLAEDLCANAKRVLKSDFPDSNYSLIDWHIEQGDLLGSIGDIRDNHYITNDGKSSLTMRPLYLNKKDKWNSYKNFKIACEHITKLEIDESKIARNKIKELKEILKKSESETEVFLKSNKLEYYFRGFKKGDGEYCFSNNCCMYYDAIEVMDLYMELNKKGDQND